MLFKKCLQCLLFICLSFWFGSGLYFTCFAAPELFSGFPIDTASKAVGLLFPTFFTLSAILSIVCWVLYVVLARQENDPGKASRVLHGLLLIGTICSLANRLYFLPTVQSLESKMGPISGAPAALIQRFGIVHGISMLVQFVELVVVLCIWIVIGWKTSIRFKNREVM